MNVQLGVDIDLNDKQVLAFLINAKNGDAYDSKIMEGWGYTKVRTKEVDNTSPAGSNQFTIYTTRKRYYITYKVRIEDGLRKEDDLGEFFLNIPVEHTVQLNIVNNLFVKKGSVHEAQIIKAFEDYDPQMGDPNEYAQQFPADSFFVTPTYRLYKLSSRELDEQYKKLFDLYPEDRVDPTKDCGIIGGIETGHGIVDIISLNKSEREDGVVYKNCCIDDFYQKRNIRLKIATNREKEKYEDIAEIPTISNPANEVVLEGRKIEDVFRDKRDGGLGCAWYGIVPFNRKVCTLFKFPEFRVEWKLTTIKVGCVEIKLHLPHVKWRLCNKELHYHVDYDKKYENEWPWIRKSIEHCAFESAITSAVISIVLLNPGVAVPVFKETFKECMFKRAEEYLSCLLPGLTIIVVPDAKGWRSFNELY